jgi:hypothetical protein
MVVAYDDGLLRLDEGGVTLRRYYFPWAGSKHIAWSQVRGVRVRRMTWLTGKGRIWGTATLTHWLPLDLRRPGKAILLVFDVGRRVKPCVSPDDPRQVIDLLRLQAPVVED